MDIYDAIKTRRSVRAYKSEAVPEKVLNRILEATRLAPSAHNAQKYKFVLVRDSEKKEALAKAASQEFISQAPVVIVAVSLDPDYLMECEVPSYAVDIAIALDHLTLAAVAEGLGTCWIGAFSQEDVKKILNIPERYKVTALMPLGFPDNNFNGPTSRTRKGLRELFSTDKFVNR